MFGVVGFSFAGRGQNMGITFVRLKDWDERTRPDQSVQAIAGRAFGALSQIRDAMVFPIVPPAVTELGNVSGFDFYIQARGGQSHDELLAARNQLLGMASQSKLIGSIRPNGLEDAAQYNLDIDWRKAGAMGVTADDVAQLLQIAWAGSYVNDFLNEGRIKRVYVQGEPGRPLDARGHRPLARAQRHRRARALRQFRQRRVALRAAAADPLQRRAGDAAAGSARRRGSTTGEAMAEIMRLAEQLPPGFDIAWTGLSLEERESGAQAPLLYALSLMAVFLCLAALYESWAMPFAVMLAMPIGIVGALTGAWIGGFENGVFFQVALLTVVGLTGKNAILIVEFAKELQEAGQPLYQAVREAARRRFRPIIMTSMAFCLGVLPLVLSAGAGSAGRNAIGSGVLGGTLSATILGVVFVPIFYVVVRRLAPLRQPAGATPAATPAE